MGLCVSGRSSLPQCACYWFLPLFVSRAPIYLWDGVEERGGVTTMGTRAYCRTTEGVHVAQWAKRPPLKLEVPGSSPRGWFNGRAENRDPFRWLETARGLEPIRLIGRAQCFPGGLAVSSL